MKRPGKTRPFRSSAWLCLADERQPGDQAVALLRGFREGGAFAGIDVVELDDDVRATGSRELGGIHLSFTAAVAVIEVERLARIEVDVIVVIAIVGNYVDH